YAVEWIEHLDRSLFAELLQPLLELFVLFQIPVLQRRKVLRREPRNVPEMHGSGAADRVADREEARVRQTNDVAGIRLFYGFPTLSKQLVGPGKSDLLPMSRVDDLHVALELPGADSQEGDAVPMEGVHVRLDLEDESGELLRVG